MTDPLDDLARAELDETQDLIAQEAERIRIRQRARVEVESEGWSPPVYEGGLLWQRDNVDQDDPFMVDDILPFGINLLSAQYKAGKTTVASVNLARALVGGTPWLGKFATNLKPDQSVGIWNMEVNQTTLVNWLLADEMTDDQLSRIHPLHLRGKSQINLENPLHGVWVVSWLKQNNVKVWIIDPYSKLYGGEENSASEVNRWWRALERIKDAADVDMVLIIHHSGKGDKSDSSLPDPRGSSALQGNADAILTYRHGGGLGELPPDDKRYLQALGRNVDVKEMTLTFDRATQRLTVDTASRGRAADKAETWAVRVHQAIASAPGQQVESKGALDNLLGRTGGNQDVIARGIAQAVQQGYVNVTTGGKTGRTQIYTLGEVNPRARVLVATTDEQGEPELKPVRRKAASTAKRSRKPGRRA